jgi:hypothetical protein
LEIYFVLLDAGLPLELSALKKIVQDTAFDFWVGLSKTGITLTAEFNGPFCKI